jgi:hypothetical protein
MVRQLCGQQVKLQLDVAPRLVFQLTLAMQGIDQLPLCGNQQQIDLLGALGGRSIGATSQRDLSWRDSRNTRYSSFVISVSIPRVGINRNVGTHVSCGG